MFDFMFGGKRKLERIRERVEQRMREAGFDDMDSKLRVKQLGKIQLMGTPEGAIVTIVETVIKMQKRMVLLGQILSSIENHRRSLGSDPQEFSKILKVAQGPEAGNSVGMYVYYRLNIEHPGRVSVDQCMNSVGQSAMEISAE